MPIVEPSKELVDALLDAVEQRELPSLRWGYVDGSFGESEVDSLAEEVASALGVSIDPEELVEWMLQHSLLLEFSIGSSPRYRSRFAEGVRLLTRLKQLMPNQPWRTAPDLVSDYRIDARPRSLPARNFDLDASLSELEQIGNWNNDMRSLAVAFVGNRSLSGFQIRSAQAILRTGQRDFGTVLTSGTGSGKTLAFYLPVALQLGPLLLPGSFWTKVVAVFPRIELLKDQFTQAHSLLAPLTDTLRAHGQRPFRIGTFFSGTPWNSTPEAAENARWLRHREGFICPFLICPSCNGPLVWLSGHMEKGDERLTCADGCRNEIGDEHLVLTRTRARRQPPDIMFTTPETLNQRMSDTGIRHVFGIVDDQSRRARALLLDEIHTYGGTSGAQAALVFRRWRHAVGRETNVRYVGLSATLADASRFFASLTGLRTDSVTEIAPYEEEMTFQAMEYQLILRGDPASRAQLLSTTIQASFLLARLLDPLGSNYPSEGRYGSRVFAFTDDLDATNRLFDFLRDAEGRDIFGRAVGSREPLAALRGQKGPNLDQRMRDGQDWTRLQRLGRPLAQRLNVSRTSSQDPGVDPNADIIVATAALEVGFNDPLVGAIIQHKSPYQLSTFVQRKGRAGRVPSMRPWVITVLSDYGRDRATFQSYDQLFDPILKPVDLPVRNRYILRMQATFAMLDWLATVTRGNRGWLWHRVSGPHNSTEARPPHSTAILKVLTEILESPGEHRRRLSNHVRWALRLESQEEVSELLWGSPRSLLLEVLPTLARRLAMNWELYPSMQGTGYTDLASSGPPHPLPDFLPVSLFSDLNLPEVSIVVPPATRFLSERIESMPIAQTIGRLAPGRVTRRFAPERGRLNHWIPVPLENGKHSLRISEYAEHHEFVASISVNVDGTVMEIPCYRPWTIKLQIAPDREVQSTSNAWQQWNSQILTQGLPISMSTGNDPRWGQLIMEIDFHMHAFHAPITMRRYALEAHATVKAPSPRRTEFNVVTRYTTDDGRVCAVGFEQEVDAIRVSLRLPKPADLILRAEASRSAPAWRRAYFRDLVLEDPELSEVCNWFQRDWLQHIFLTALLELAASSNNVLSEALDVLLTLGMAGVLGDVASRIFELNNIEGDGEELPSDFSDRSRATEAERNWRELLAQNIVSERLRALAAELFAPNIEMWGAWLFRRTHETFGEALISAAYGVAPDQLSENSLLLDLDRGDPHHGLEDYVEVWLSEDALGGTGAVEAVARKATSEPRSFLSALESAISPSDMELTVKGLDELIELAANDPIVVTAMAEVRRQVSHKDRLDVISHLYRLLAAKGLVVDQGFTVAMNHRILREGTDNESDRLLRDLVREWHNLESRLQIAIDLRTFSFIASSHEEFGPRLDKIVRKNTDGTVSPSEAAGVLSGVLWPRRAEVSGRVFRSFGPFRTQGYTDPSFIRDLLLDTSAEEISYGCDGWRDRFADAIARTGMAQLKVRHAEVSVFHRDIYQILATPVDVDYLQFYPVISDVNREKELGVTFILREMF